MKRGHVHTWRLISPHPFGARVTYKCASCAETKVQNTQKRASQISELERRLGISVQERGNRSTDG